MRVRGSSPAVRVAAVATAAIALLYIIGAIVLNLVVARHMTQQDDDQLSDRLTTARHHPDTLRQRVARGDPSSDLDADTAPVFLWAVNARRVVVAHSPGAPALPPALLTADALHDGSAVTANLGRSAPFRLKVAPAGPLITLQLYRRLAPGSFAPVDAAARECSILSWESTSANPLSHLQARNETNIAGCTADVSLRDVLGLAGGGEL